MRIRSRSSRGRTDRITLNMASMIDITFLLLAYFVLTSVLVKPEDQLSPTLQTESRGAQASSDFQIQKVEVTATDSQPVYRLGTRLLQTRDELRDVLSRLPTEPGLFIHVHDDVPVGFAVAAIQIARDVGFTQVTYVPAE